MKNIIVLDSKAYVRNRVKELLNDYDTCVYEAVNSIQLFNILSEINYDVSMIIIEVNLNKESGFDIINKIKNKGIEVPILVLTSENRRKEFVKAVRAGIVDYILKPFDENILKDRIEKGMKKKNINVSKDSGEEKKKASTEFEDYLYKEIENAQNAQNSLSLMMVTLFKSVDKFTSTVEREYTILGNEIQYKLKDVTKDADLFIRHGVQSFIAVFRTSDEEREKTLSLNIIELFKGIREKDKRFEEYHLEYAFVDYPKEGDTKEELISSATHKIVTKINQLKRMEKK